MGVGDICQGNVGQISVMLIGLGAKCQGDAGECMGVGAKQKNADECQGNKWKWVQSAKGMPGERMGIVQSVR